MHPELHILKLVRAAAAFLNKSDQLFAADIQAYKIKLVFVFKIVINKPLVDSPLTNVVDRSSGVTVCAEFLQCRFQYSGYSKLCLFSSFHKYLPMRLLSNIIMLS